MDVTGGLVSYRNMTKRGAAEGVFLGFEDAKRANFSKQA